MTAWRAHRGQGHGGARGSISDIAQQITSRYLREAHLGNNVLQLDIIMGRVDVGALLGLARSFSADGLMCPHANIAGAPTVQQWVDGIKHGRTVTVLALKNAPGDSSSEKAPNADLAEHVAPRVEF